MQKVSPRLRSSGAADRTGIDGLLGGNWTAARCRGDSWAPRAVFRRKSASAPRALRKCRSWPNSREWQHRIAVSDLNL